MRIVYLAPLVSDSARPFDGSWAKHAQSIHAGERYSSRIFSRDPVYTLVYIEGAAVDATFVAEVEDDPECFVISVGSELIQTFDEPVSTAKRAALMAWLDEQGIPGDFLGRIPCTARQACWYITSYAMFAQRFQKKSNVASKSLREAFIARGRGGTDRDRIRDVVSRPWSDLSRTPELRALKDELVAGWELWPHFGKWADVEPGLDGASVEQLIHETIFRCRETFLGGQSLFVPEARNILRMLDGSNYGDNRNETINEALSNDTNFTNPSTSLYTAWNVTGGEFQTTASIVSYAAQHNDAIADDQYVRGTLGTVGDYSGGGDSVFIGVDGRKSTTANNEEAYRGEVSNDSPQYRITEVQDDFAAFPTIDSATGNAPDSGDIITLEIDGTTLHMGTDEGGGDTVRVQNASDASYSSGGVELACYRDHNETYGFTAFTAGDFQATPATDQVSDRFYNDDGGHP